MLQDPFLLFDTHNILCIDLMGEKPKIANNRLNIRSK